MFVFPKICWQIDVAFDSFCAFSNFDKISFVSSVILSKKGSTIDVELFERSV